MDGEEKTMRRRTC